MIVLCHLRFNEMVRRRFRFIFSWCFLSLLGAAVVLGAGNYQPTKDGKTFVWNGTPRPGDAATWDGDRDKEGYATGFGSLTWYTASGNVFALYYGNMVHGKFEGLVNVHSRGKTGHAMFVDGERNSPWATGPAPSRPEAGLAVRSRNGTENKPTAKREVSQTKSEVASSTTEKTAKPAKKTETETIKQTPPAVAEKSVEPGSVEDELRRTEPARESEVSAAPAVSATPPVTKQATDAGTFEPTPIPKSEMQAGPTLDRQRTDSPKLPAQESETIPKVSANETPKEVATEPIATPPAEPSAEKRSEDRSQQSQTQPSNPPSAKEAPADVSLNALAGPPSSLRTGPPDQSAMEKTPATRDQSSPQGPTTVETPLESTTQPKTKSSPAPERGEAQLSESDAIGAVDAAVRAFGGDPNHYQRPKVDYSSVTDKWTLFYVGNSTLSTGPRSFTATVEDKTKKVEFKK